MATSRPIRGSALALAALTAATALALTRVFADARWLLACVVCVALAHAVGTFATARQWSGPRTFAAHLAACFLVTIWIVVPDGTVAGIPTASAIADWFHAVSRSVHVLRTAVVPVPAVGAALLLALVALWAAAAASQWSATRLDGILGAMVPQLALFVAIGALGRGSYFWATTVWAAAAAAFLLTAHLERLTQARTWFQSRGSHPSRLVGGGAVACVLAVFVAALLGPHLPGSGAAAWLHYRSWGHGKGNGPGTISAISPLVDIGSELNTEPEVELFTVQSSAPARWRQVALDSFDGVQWTLTAPTGNELPPAPEPTQTINIEQQFRLTALGGNFLPAAYRAASVHGAISGLQTVADSATLVVSDENHSGLAYSVTSAAPFPSDASLRGSQAVDPKATSPDIRRALELPHDLDGSISVLANTIVTNAHATTPYLEAIAIQTYLRSKPFTYDQHIAAYNKPDALHRFLFVTHKGFCQQYAGAFGALARAVGLPTRLAVGFLPGKQVAGVYHVFTKDAHAWPEVYLDNIGWIAFEPTPSRFDDTSLGNPNQTGGTDTQRTTPTSTAGASSSLPGVRPTVPKGEPRNSPGLTVAAPGSGAHVHVGPVGVLALAVGFVGLVLVVGTRGARLLRRWRRRRAPDPRERILGAWAETVDALAGYDITRAPSRTPVEFAMRDAPALGAGAGGPALITLARLSTAAMYAPDTPSDDEADSAWQCERTVATALKDRPRRSRRRLGRRHHGERPHPTVRATR